MSYVTRSLVIRHQGYDITTDPDYGKHLAERFEPNTVALLESLCDHDSLVLDIGANIGITGIALSQLCPQGKIAAIEPVPATYKLLKRNIARSEIANITTYNFALGNANGEIVMQGNPQTFLALSLLTSMKLLMGFTSAKLYHCISSTMCSHPWDSTVWI